MQDQRQPSGDWELRENEVYQSFPSSAFEFRLKPDETCAQNNQGRKETLVV
jgi:hypothetical protein